MYNIFLNAHSGFAYLTLTMAILAVFFSLYYFINKKEICNWSRKAIMFSMILMHLQLLLGIALFFTSPRVKSALELGMGAVMGDANSRKLIVEHPIMMILAALLMTLANAKTKKVKNMTLSILIFTVLALAAILLVIPWGQWMA